MSKFQKIIKNSDQISFYHHAIKKKMNDKNTIFSNFLERLSGNFPISRKSFPDFIIFFLILLKFPILENGETRLRFWISFQNLYLRQQSQHFALISTLNKQSTERTYLMMRVR